VDQSIGAGHFDGRPNEVTTKKLYDFLDVSRGVSAFLDGMPAAPGWDCGTRVKGNSLEETTSIVAYALHYP
jgi:hypothetical protein